MSELICANCAGPTATPGLCLNCARIANAGRMNRMARAFDALVDENMRILASGEIDWSYHPRAVAEDEEE